MWTDSKGTVTVPYEWIDINSSSNQILRQALMMRLQLVLNCPLKYLFTVLNTIVYLFRPMAGLVLRIQGRILIQPMIHCPRQPGLILLLRLTGMTLLRIPAMMEVFLHGKRQRPQSKGYRTMECG